MAGCTGDSGGSQIPPWERAFPGRDPNFPIEGQVNVEIEADLPSSGADPSEPLVCDEYHWYGDFCLEAGHALIELPVRIRNGAIDLSGDLASLSGLRFTSWCAIPDFFPHSIRLDEEGEPHLVGKVGPISNYWERIRALDTFPLGFDQDGQLVCDEDDRAFIENPLVATRWFREHGLPPSLTFSSLLYLADNFQAAQAAGGCPPDPDLRVNLPSDPASLVSRISLRGEMRATGPVLMIPESANRPPVEIRFGEGENSLRTSLTVRQNAGRFEPNGSINATFDVQEIEVATRRLPGPHQGSLSVTAAETGIITELSAWLTLPQARLPLPVPAVLEGGAIEIPSFYLFLEPNPSPDSLAGHFRGRVALRDVRGTLEGKPVELDARLAANGEFSLDQTLLSARLHLDTDMSGQAAGSHAEARLTGDLSIEDYGLCDASGALSVQRHLNLENLAASISGGHGGFSISGNDRAITGELHVVADMVGQNLGRMSEARINTRISGVRLETPEGTFTISGRLVGKMKLVNISDDPSKLDLRPVAGSLRFEVKDATVRRDGEILGRGVTIEVRDDPWGRITVSARAASPLLERFGIGSPSTSLEIQIPPEGRRGFQFAQECSADEVFSSADDGVGYYEPSAIDDLAASFLMRVVQRNIGVIAARGNAAVRGLSTGNPQVDFQATLPFGRREIDLPAASITLSGGGVTASGTANRIGVTLRPPETVQIGFRQERDGITYDFRARVAPAGSFRTVIDPKRQRVVIPHDSHAITGTLEVTARDAQGNTIGSGTVALSSRYEISGAMDRNRGHLSLRIPETGLTGRVSQEIRLGQITIPAGSELTIPITGFGGTVSIDPATLQMRSRWTAADVGPVTLSLPGSPLANLTAAPLPGPVSLNLSGRANGQQFLVQSNPREGVSLSAADPSQPYDLTVQAAVGEALAVQLQSQTRAEGIEASYDPATGQIGLSIRDFSLFSEVNGHVDLPGLPLNLNGLDTTAALNQLTFSFNPQTGEVRFGLQPHPISTMTLPPEDLDHWLAWTREDWRQYREAMNDPNRRHLAVLSEESANLPGSPFPPGRGKIYVDTPPTEQAVNLHDFANVGAAVSHLLREVVAHLEIRREYPNPPIPSPYTGESLVYSEGQDALFILNPSDTELIEHMEFGLGIPNEEARRFFQNGRIDIADLVKTPFLKENFAPEAVRGLVDTFFRNQPAGNFSNNSHRFFLALGDIRTGLPRLVGFHPEFWGDRIRSVVPRNFNEPAYLGETPHGGDGVNMTVTAYLPYPPEGILPLVSNLADYRYWMPWVAASRREADGSFTGTIDGRYRYRVRGETTSHGPIRSFSYQPTAGRSASEMEVFSGRTVLVPKTDSEGRVVGTFVIWQQAIDFPGPDALIYKGRDEDLSALADPERPFFSTEHRYLIDFPLIGHRLNRLSHPNQNPVEILPFRLARGISNLYRLLYENRSPREMDLNRYQATPASLTTTPDGVVTTGRPRDFLTMSGKAILLEVDPGERGRVVTLLRDGLGIDQVGAEGMIQAGKIEISDLAGLDFVRRVFTPETVESLARLFLVSQPGVNEPFISRGERFLLFLKDLRERFNQWSDADRDGARAIDFRGFTQERFHVWSSHNNRNRADGTDNVSYTVLPADLPLEALLDSFSHPENFTRYSDDYISAVNAPCENPRPGTRCIDSRLNLVVAEVDYRIEIPEGLQYVGNVGIAPWHWTTRPDVPDNLEGFEENEGLWVLAPLKENQGTLLLRLGLLNTRLTGDAAMMQQASGRMATFVEGVYRGTADRLSQRVPPFRIEFGRVFETR